MYNVSFLYTSNKSYKVPLWYTFRLEDTKLREESSAKIQKEKLRTLHPLKIKQIFLLTSFVKLAKPGNNILELSIMKEELIYLEKNLELNINIHYHETSNY